MRSLPQPRDSNGRRLKRMIHAILQYLQKGYIEDGSAFDMFSHRSSNDSKIFKKIFISAFGFFDFHGQFKSSETQGTTDEGRNLAGKITGINKQGRRRKYFRSSSKRALRRGLIKVPLGESSVNLIDNIKVHRDNIYWALGMS